MRKFVDLTNKIFGEWLVIEKISNSVRKQTFWKCLCNKCGKYKNVRSNLLRSGKSTQCQDCFYKSKIIDLSGKTFGYWTVLEIDKNDNSSHETIWKCRCKCGIIKNIIGRLLKNKLSTKCRKCCNEESRLKLSGKKFGKWKILDIDNEKTSKSKSIYWKCECECGTQRSISGSRLFAGKDIRCKKCYSLDKVINLTNQTFGQWNIIEYISDGKWLCKCSCGNIKKINGFNLRNKTTLRCSGCHRDHTHIPGSFFGRIKGNAKIRKLLFSITKEEIWKLFLSQNEKCRFCNIKLEIIKTHKEYIKNKSLTKNHASLDRINSLKGYTLDNVQWTCIRCNLAKNNMSDEDFIELCSAISKNNQFDP